MVPEIVEDDAECEASSIRIGRDRSANMSSGGRSSSSNIAVGALAASVAASPLVLSGATTAYFASASRLASSIPIDTNARSMKHPPPRYV
jgi:hypothetical protein